MTERRRSIATAGGVLAAAAITDAPAVIAQPKVLDDTSGGRFRIEVFPSGQIMPPLECFDAASQGTRRMTT